MVVLGLILLVGGLILALCGVFLTTGSDAALLGIDMQARTVFVLGVVAGAAVIWGFMVLKYGTKREWKQRQEQKKMEELSAKLAEVERSKLDDNN